MDSLKHDTRAALRRLTKTPWFTLAVGATLTIAIGATTLIFSVVDGVLLRPLPLGNADRLVAVSPAGKGPTGVSVLDLADWQQQCRHLDGFASYVLSPANMTNQGDPVRLNAALVSANWFSLLGVRLELGRGFAPNEDTPQATKVIVMSDALWRSRFGASAAVLGRSLDIDGDAYTVIGVAPPHITYPRTPDVWLPLVQPPASFVPSARAIRFLNVVGRIARGSTMAAARADLAAVTERLRRQYPDADARARYTIAPLQEVIVGDARTGLLVLFGAVACLLLIACANVTNLLLVRATGRATEIALRVAIGANRRRIMQQLLVESVLLSLIGAVAGTLVAFFAMQVLVAARPANLPRLDDVALNGRVLIFTILAAGGTGVLFGLAPALQAARIDLREVMQSATRGASAHRKSGRVRGMLVVAETSLAVVLLIGAGLLTRSLLQMMRVNPGFRPERTVIFNVNITSAKYLDWAQARRFVHAVNDKLAALPGTQITGYGRGVPFAGFDTPMPLGFHIDDRAPDAANPPAAEVFAVSPSFFAALGIPLRQGRAFTNDDRWAGPGVVAISRATAERFFSDGQAIGRRITFDAQFDSTGRGDRTPLAGEIVGIAEDTKLENLTTSAPPIVYVPFDQVSTGFVTFVVRTTAAPATVLGAVAHAVTAVDPDVPIFAARTLTDAVGESVARPRLYAAVVAAFATAALLLAVIGIYGMLAYSVRERRRELGIRLALGARPSQIVGLVVGQGLRLTVLGLSIGVVTAFLGGHILASLLFGVRPNDVPTYEIVCATLLGVATLASWLPARSAAGIDPVLAMRSP